MDIGEIIAGKRGELNLSQRALAQKAGIRQATLSSIESGGDVKMATARNILLALGLDFDVVPVRAANKSLIAERQAEIRRVLKHFRQRRLQLQSLLDTLSALEIRHVQKVNKQTNYGYLAGLWDEFLRLEVKAMKQALDGEQFHGMAWQSLLQANPFIMAKVGKGGQMGQKRGKIKPGPMTLGDVELLLLEAARLSNHRNFVIAGSLSVLGAVMNPPDDMLMSRDVDLYTKLDPDRVFVEIASEIAEGSRFHAAHGFYADPISPRILTLPDGWESRMISVTLANGVVANFIEPNDVAVAKLARSNDNDIRWVRSGVKAGIINLDVVDARLKDTHNILKGELKKIRASIKSIRAE